MGILNMKTLQLLAETRYTKRLIKEVTPSGIISLVADSYDFWGFVKYSLPALKDTIMERDGTLVIRPDSGDPVEILCGREFISILPSTDMTTKDVENLLKLTTKESLLKESIRDWLHDELLRITPFGREGDDITDYFVSEGKYYKATFVGEWNRHDKQFYYLEGGECTVEDYTPTAEDKGLVESLWDTFGGTIVDGYKLLDPHIGAIYGDSITLERQDKIIGRLLAKGFVPSVVLGIGSFTYQYVTRDTHGSAVKATNIVFNGVETPICKDPKTDSSKKSAKGILVVHLDKDGEYVLKDNATREEQTSEDNQLKVIFRNSKLLVVTTLDEIRGRIDSTFA